MNQYLECFFIVEFNGFVRAWSSAAENILGWRKEEIEGQSFFEKLVAKSSISDGKKILRGFSNLKPGCIFSQTDKLKLVHSSGSEIGFNMVLSYGGIQPEIHIVAKRALGFQSDSTYKDQNEFSVETILNALPISVSYVDKDYCFRYVNSNYSKWRNLSKEQIVGRSVFEHMDPETYKVAKSQMERVLAGQVVNYEFQLEYFDGPRYLDATLLPDFDQEQKVRGYTAVLIDISERQNRIDSLRKSKLENEVANNAKDTFLANMSHEFRSPLGVILGFSELLAKPDLQAAERMQYIESIKRNGRFLSKIIEDILDLSKVEAGKLEINKTNVKLGEIIEDIHSMIQLKAKDKNLILDFKIDPDVPEFVFTDSLRLVQILLNIIGNAIKFTESGGVSVRVGYEKLNEQHEELCFIVEDTGCGICPSKVSNLFLPFSQVDDSIVRKASGTGLGLVLSKKLAHLLGGNLILEKSVLGRGSIFKISIDPELNKLLNIERTEAEIGAGLSDKLKKTQHRLKGFNILLAEDNLDNQVLLRSFLGQEGGQLDIAENGKVALRKLREKKYDVIIMDVQMPILCGDEAIVIARAEGTQTPALALTAHSLRNTQKHLLDIGFNEFCAKPFNKEELIEKIAFLCQNNMSHMSL